MKKETVLALIPRQGILPLYFNKDTQVSIDLLKALYSAGIRAVEYTNRGEAALTNFKAMRNVCETELKDMYWVWAPLKMEKWLKPLLMPVAIISFVRDWLKVLQKLLMQIICSGYPVV